MIKNQRLLKQAFATLLLCALLVTNFASGLIPVKAQEENRKERIFEKFRNPDRITGIVRDKSNEFRNIRINSIKDREKAEKLGTIVEDYGSFVVVAKRKSSKNVESHLDEQKLETAINLPGGKFEPIVEGSAETVTEKNAAAEFASEPTGKDYFIVQTASIAKDEWLKSFEEIGAEVIQYVPHQAFFVYADSEAISKITNHSRVRWVGRYAAEQKIPPFVKNHLKKAGIESELGIFEIAVFKNTDLRQSKNEILSSTNAQILKEMELPNNYFNIIRVKVPVSELENIARLKGIVQIDEYVKPMPEDERSSQIIAGNYVNATTLMPPGYNPLAQFGVDGSNVTVSVCDDGISIPGNGGFYLTAANVKDGPLRGATSGAEGGHGHLNASIIGGSTPFGPLDPLGYNYGLGVAPRVSLINIPFLKENNDTNYIQSVTDSFDMFGTNGVRTSIVNNSWGGSTNNNGYSTLEATFDGLVLDGSSQPTIDPMTIIFSAGNCGLGSTGATCDTQTGLTRPKSGKNTISVGSSENIRKELRSTADNIDDLSGSSSRGPTVDGRIKPDIIAPGYVITGSAAGSGTGIFGAVDDFHNYSGGTSHSAPQISGVAALFTQFWKNNTAGANPSPAMVKAAILNSAQEMNGLNTSIKIPNGDEGWGRVNMKNMFNTGVPMKYIDQAVQFSDPGTSIVYDGVVGDSTKPFRVSLVWSDPPGVTSPALVNNLDLKVTVGGTIYKGNVFSNGLSVSEGAFDSKDNVENVFLAAGIPAGTPVKIEVTAITLNGDGIRGNADTSDQNFAVVAYNYTEQQTAQRNKASDFEGDRRADIALWRPSNGAWYMLRSSNGAFTGIAFGQMGDLITPGDYDGDGKTDIAVFRPSTGTWYFQMTTQGFLGYQFGQNGDLPVQGDYDGDGKTDIAVFRPSNGAWYIMQSRNGFIGTTFGAAEDKPVQGDYDGDGKTDVAVFRPSNGAWYIMQSQNGFTAMQFGFGTDKLVPQDYDGDGKTDIAVFRPSNGAWYIMQSRNGFAAYTFGAAEDIPAPADYDGDNRADICVFRPSTGSWYFLKSSDGSFYGIYFGTSGDLPIGSAYIPIQ